MGNTNDNRFGKNNPFFGKHHSDETRLKISEKMSNGNHHQAKKITRENRVPYFLDRNV
jgi:hypothetical protein